MPASSRAARWFPPRCCASRASSRCSSRMLAPRRPAIAASIPSRRPTGMVPSCSEAGVMGAVTGVMGTLQATEVLKEILGIGESLSGRLLIWDALAARMRTVRLRRDPACLLCGEAGEIRDLSAHAHARPRPVPSERRSASCCSRAGTIARTTPSCSQPARRRSGARSSSSRPISAATRCSPTGPASPRPSATR